MATILLRFTLIASALVVGVWLAAGLRVSFLEEEGQTAFDRARRGSLSRTDLAHARDALRSAGALTLDPGPELIESRLLAAAAREDEAAVVIIRVLADEPKNVDAWYLAHLAARTEGGLALTRRRVQALNPLLGDQLE